MPLPPYGTIDELIGYYTDKLDRDAKNMERVKKFYHDEESFDQLMEKLVEKDLKRFKKLIDTALHKFDNSFPTPWKFFFILLDIVQSDGEEIPPFDTLTRMHASKSILYHGWTFSWVHGENDLISIFNRKNELVYRF